jgi:hypothetical protein
MTTINQDFSMYAGDSKNIVITVTDDNGSPMNLLNATVKWALKKRVKSTENMIYKTTTDGITITDAQNGLIKISLLPINTSSLSGMYYHECEVTDQSGNVSTVTTGYITVKESGV